MGTTQKFSDYEVVHDVDQSETGPEQTFGDPLKGGRGDPTPCGATVNRQRTDERRTTRQAMRPRFGAMTRFGSGDDLCTLR